MQTNTYLCKSCYNFSYNGHRIINPKTILLGQERDNHHGSYFYLPLNHLPIQTNIIHAEFILYPIRDSLRGNNCCLHYIILPSAEFFNPFRDSISPALHPKLHPLEYWYSHNQTLLCFDVTSLVKLWIGNLLNNRGFYLNLANCNGLQLLGGTNYSGVEPFLQITYDLPITTPPPYHENCVSLPIQIDFSSE